MGRLGREDALYQHIYPDVKNVKKQGQDHVKHDQFYLQPVSLA